MDCGGRSSFGGDYGEMDRGEDDADSDLEARLYAEVYYTSDISAKPPEKEQLTTITDVIDSWKKISEKCKTSEENKQDTEKKVSNSKNEHSRNPARSVAGTKNLKGKKCDDESPGDVPCKEKSMDSSRKAKQAEKTKTVDTSMDAASIDEQKTANSSTKAQQSSFVSVSVENSQQSDSTSSDDSLSSAAGSASKAKSISKASTTNNDSSSSENDSDTSSSSTSEDESEKDEDAKSSKQSPKRKSVQKKSPKKFPIKTNTVKPQNSPKLPGKSTNSSKSRRRQIQRSKQATSSFEGPFVFLESSSDSSQEKNSKYNVTLQRKKIKEVEIIKVDDSDNNGCYELSDSDDSILEVPVPPKPKPPMISLQDSDNACTERESEDEMSLNSSSDSSNSDEEMEAPEVKSKKGSLSQGSSSQQDHSEESDQSCPSDVRSQDCSVMPKHTEGSKTPSSPNKRDNPQCSVPANLESGPGFMNTKDSQTSSAADPQARAKCRSAEPVLDDLMLNCTEIQKGAASLEDIRSLAGTADNDNQGHSDDSMTENEASSWGIIADGQRNQIDQQPEESCSFESVTRAEKKSPKTPRRSENKKNETTEGAENQRKDLEEEVSAKDNQVDPSDKNQEMILEGRQVQDPGNLAEEKEKLSRGEGKSKSLENDGEPANIVSGREDKSTPGRDKKEKSSVTRKRLSESLGRSGIGDKRARYFDGEGELEQSGSGMGVQKNRTRRSRRIRRSRSMSDYFFRPMSDEMKKFYDESWGGENFDIARIRSEMPKDPRQWAVLDADLAGSRTGKGGRYWAPGKCTNCRQSGHTWATCPEARKIIKCHMCGTAGHRESRCPDKKCLSCGRKQKTYTTSCNACRDLCCKLCRSSGHSEDNCPDLWRRYHQTPLRDEVNPKYTEQQNSTGKKGNTNQQQPSVKKIQPIKKKDSHAQIRNQPAMLKEPMDIAQQTSRAVSGIRSRENSFSQNVQRSNSIVDPKIVQSKRANHKNVPNISRTVPNVPFPHRNSSRKHDTWRNLPSFSTASHNLININSEARNLVFPQNHFHFQPEPHSGHYPYPSYSSENSNSFQPHLGFPLGNPGNGQRMPDILRNVPQWNPNVPFNNIQLINKQYYNNCPPDIPMNSNSPHRVENLFDNPFVVYLNNQFNPPNIPGIPNTAFNDIIYPLINRTDPRDLVHQSSQMSPTPTLYADVPRHSDVPNIPRKRNTMPFPAKNSRKYPASSSATSNSVDMLRAMTGTNQSSVDGNSKDELTTYTGSEDTSPITLETGDFLRTNSELGDAKVEVDLAQIVDKKEKEEYENDGRSTIKQEEIKQEEKIISTTTVIKSEPEVIDVKENEPLTIEEPLIEEPKRSEVNNNFDKSAQKKPTDDLIEQMILTPSKDALLCQTADGRDYLQKIGNLYNCFITREAKPAVPYSNVLNIYGAQRYDVIAEIKLWFHFPFDVSTLGKIDLPNDRETIIAKLTEKLRELDGFLGTPLKCLKDIENLEKTILELSETRDCDLRHQLTKRTLMKKVEDAKINLNMILFGQAGLNGGDDMVYRMKTLLWTLKYVQKSKHLENEVYTDLHLIYRRVFSAYIPSNLHDLLESLGMYNILHLNGVDNANSTFENLEHDFSETTSSLDVNIPSRMSDVMKPLERLSCCNCAKRGHESSTCKKYRWMPHFPTPPFVTSYTKGACYEWSPEPEIQERAQRKTKNLERNLAKKKPAHGTKTGESYDYTVDSIAFVDFEPSVQEGLAPVPANSITVESVKENEPSESVVTNSSTTEMQTEQDSPILDESSVDSVLFACGTIPNRNKFRAYRKKLLRVKFSISKIPLRDEDCEILTDSDGRKFLIFLTTKCTFRLLIKRLPDNKKILCLKGWENLIEVIQTLIDNFLHWSAEERSQFVCTDVWTSIPEVYNFLFSKLEELNLMENAPSESLENITSTKEVLTNQDSQILEESLNKIDDNSPYVLFACGNVQNPDDNTSSNPGEIRPRIKFSSLDVPLSVKDCEILTDSDGRKFQRFLQFLTTKCTVRVVITSLPGNKNMLCISGSQALITIVKTLIDDWLRWSAEERGRFDFADNWTSMPEIYQLVFSKLQELEQVDARTFMENEPSGTVIQSASTSELQTEQSPQILDESLNETVDLPYTVLFACGNLLTELDVTESPKQPGKKRPRTKLSTIDIPLREKECQVLTELDGRKFLQFLTTNSAVRVQIKRLPDNKKILCLKGSKSLITVIRTLVEDWLRWPAEERSRFIYTDLPTNMPGMYQLLSSKLKELELFLGEPVELCDRIRYLKDELTRMQARGDRIKKRRVTVDQLAQAQCKLNMILFGQGKLDGAEQSVNTLKQIAENMSKSVDWESVVPLETYLRVVHHFNKIFAAYTPSNLPRLLDDFMRCRSEESSPIDKNKTQFSSVDDNDSTLLSRLHKQQPKITPNLKKKKKKCLSNNYESFVNSLRTSTPVKNVRPNSSSTPRFLKSSENPRYCLRGSQKAKADFPRTPQNDRIWAPHPEIMPSLQNTAIHPSPGFWPPGTTGPDLDFRNAGYAFDNSGLQRDFGNGRNLERDFRNDQLTREAKESAYRSQMNTEPSRLSGPSVRESYGVFHQGPADSFRGGNEVNFRDFRSEASSTLDFISLDGQSDRNRMNVNVRYDGVPPTDVYFAGRHPRDSAGNEFDKERGVFNQQSTSTWNPWNFDMHPSEERGFNQQSTPTWNSFPNPSTTSIFNITANPANMNINNHFSSNPPVRGKPLQASKGKLTRKMREQQKAELKKSRNDKSKLRKKTRKMLHKMKTKELENMLEGKFMNVSDKNAYELTIQLAKKEVTKREVHHYIGKYRNINHLDKDSLKQMAMDLIDESRKYQVPHVQKAVNIIQSMVDGECITVKRLNNFARKLAKIRISAKIDKKMQC